MKRILSLLFALCFFGAVYSQSADVVTDMLAESEVTFGQVCYLSAVHQEFVADDATFEQAIQALFDKGQITQILDKDSPVSMANLALLYSKMWNVEGGLMYKITNGSSRYAFKQLKADGVIAEGEDPSAFASGVQALNLYTSCAIQYGGMTLNTNE